MDHKDRFRGQDFDSVYGKILQLATSKLSSEYIHIDSYVSGNDYFSKKISTVLTKGLVFKSGRVNHNFPPFFSCSTTFNFGGASKVRASSQEYGYDSYDLVTLKAKGEFLERVSSLYPLDEYKKAKYNPSLLEESYNPSVRVKMLTNPFRYKTVDRSVVYFGFKPPSLFFGDRKVTQPTSNGCAGHFNKENAVIGGLLELIQRDSFLVYWLNTISPKKIILEKFIQNSKDKKNLLSHSEKKLHMLDEDMKRYNITYHLLDITSDVGVPVVCCVVESTHKGERCFGIGASAGFSIEDTIIRAVSEAMVMYIGCYSDEPFQLKKDYVPFSDSSINQKRRTSLYNTKTQVDHFLFFIQGEKITYEEWKREHSVYMDVSLISSEKQISLLKKIFKTRSKHNPAYAIYV
jgi:hypothetical protein